MDERRDNPRRTADFWATVKAIAASEGHHWIARMAESLERSQAPALHSIAVEK